MIPQGATWVRFPRFVGDAAMQLPVLRILRQMGIGPLVVWGPAVAVSLVADHPLADAVLADEGKPSPWRMEWGSVSYLHATYVSPNRTDRLTN